MKILLLSNQSRSMSIFWRVLISTMLRRQCQVVCCVPAGDDYSDQNLQAIGAAVRHYELDRKGVNPLADLRSFLQLARIFRKEKPDILFATTIKPVIYGCLAASRCGVKQIYATITGLGYAFEADTPLKKIINRISRRLYRASLRHASGIFFQNPEDRRLFLDQGILDGHERILFARGTGVDTSHFAPAPLPATGKDKPLTFLLIARLLEAKGLRDYAAAAKILSSIYPRAAFQLLGTPETGRGGIAPAEINSWAPHVAYIGQTTDVRPYIANAHVIVLPSWREGTPTVLMEAMSMARPCVASDAPGCREVVKDGINGFLAEVRNPDSLATAMRKFLDNPDLVATMGQAGRKMAVADFDAREVANGILQDMGIAAP